MDSEQIPNTESGFMIKLIVIDLDGTLLNPAHIISEANRQALQWLLKYWPYPQAAITLSNAEAGVADYLQGYFRHSL
jgi:hydroxymethylpyrimidine pyrophosphatase-like HAD family hydrolase